MVTSVYEKIAGAAGISFQTSNAGHTDYSNGNIHAIKAQSAKEQLGMIAEMKEMAGHMQAQGGDASPSEATNSSLFMDLAKGTALGAAAATALGPLGAGLSLCHTGVKIAGYLKNSGQSHFPSLIGDGTDNEYSSFASEMESCSQNTSEVATAPAVTPTAAIAPNVSRWAQPIKTVIDDMGYDEFMAAINDPELTPIEKDLHKQVGHNMDQIVEINNAYEQKNLRPTAQAPAPMMG